MFGTSPAPTSGDLGSSPVFPALASSIARTAFAPAQPLSTAIGEPVELKVGPETEVRVTDASGASRTAKARDLSIHPSEYFPVPGIYRVEAEGATRFVAFNAPAAESENELATADQIQRAFSKPPATQQPRAGVWHDAYERQGNLWRFLLLAALALLMTESILAMRKFGNKR